MTADELISSYQGSNMDSEQMEVWCEEAVELLYQLQMRIALLESNLDDAENEVEHWARKYNNIT